MTKPLVVLNVVGLTQAHLGPHTPQLCRLAQDGFACPLGTVLPAVTCSAQSTILTGLLPRDHGIVANGWYVRELAEVMFWKQANQLVGGERVYEAARKRDSNYTTAKLFWWYNMYAPVDWSITPRPSYPADGRKVFDSYSRPADWKDELQAKYGIFPLLKFWGPGTDIASTRWIVDAALDALATKKPTLSLVYLPHLDYNFQRFGPDDPRCVQDLREVDAEAGRLISAARGRGCEVVVLSEYGIRPVDQPVHLNRVLRERGYLAVRKELPGWETLDAGESRAFAVADHQLAHVYVRRPEDVRPVAELLRRTSGVDMVLDRDAQREFGIDHARSGELVVVAGERSWFTYYFWLDDAVAPDYARCVDIHRKPGYDPVELFVDPTIRFPKVHVARRLARKLLGFRYYMDIIGLDASLVRGSHGRLPSREREAGEGPVFICSDRTIARDRLEMTDVKQALLDLQFGRSA